MDNFGKYRAYLLNDSSDIQKQMYMGTIIQVLSGEYNDEHQEYKTPDSYLASLPAEKISCVKELLDSVGLKIDYKGINEDTSSLENIIAALSVISYWNKIKEEYKDTANIDSNLKGKEFECDFNVSDLSEYIDDSLKSFFVALDDLGIFVTTKTIKEVNNIEEFDKLNKFYATLKEQLILEEVEQAASNLISSLDALYKNLFKGGYIGVLRPDGGLLYANGSKKSLFSKFIIEKETYLKGIASSWYNLTGIDRLAIKKEDSGLERKDYIFDENNEIYPYDMFPFMHMINLRGSQQEYNVNKLKLREDIVKYLTRKKTEGADYVQVVNSLERALLSCIFVIESNQHTIQLRASLLNNVSTFKSSITAALSNDISGAEGLNILNNKVDSRVSDIHNITVIYSMNKFEQEVLFAHKLYHGPNASPPSITAPILGIKLDGTLFRENLFGERFTTILAGSRSGKGTLTQSLLAPLIASGQSIIYLDNKPDIASLFWDLENKYQAMGKDVHFLAIDSLAQSSTFIKNELSAAPRGRVLDENGKIINLKNIPEKCPVSQTNLLLLRTFKTLQLLFLAGEIQANTQSNLPPITNYVFIDEITDLSKRLYGLYNDINGVSLPKKDDEQGKAAYEWTKKLCTMITDVNEGFGSMETMISDKHNFKFILVGQVFNNTTKWPGDRRKVSTVSGLDVGLYNKHFVYRAMSLCNKWLSGRLQVTKDDYILKDETEYKMSDKTGVFLYHTGKPNGPDNLIGNQPPVTGGTLFRSYFALVRNDITNSYGQIIDSINNGTVTEYFNEYQDVGYTNKFLYNRLKTYGQNDLKNSLNEMYDPVNNTAIRGVGFGGLLEDVAELQNIDMYSDEMVAKLNAPYDRLTYILQTAGIFDELGYTCLEDYLYDCSSDSFFSKLELDSRFWRGFKNGGKYVPAAKADNKVNYSNLDLDEDTLDDVSRVDAETQSKIEQIEQDSVGKSVEEIEQEKKKVLEEGEDEKKQILYSKLMAEFMQGFNAKKGPVGDKISSLHKKLYSYNQGQDIFDNAKQSAIDSKQTFFASFAYLLDPLKEYPECHQECESKIWDFINGRYASIENLTFEDVLNKKGSKGAQSTSGSSANDGFTPPMPTFGGQTGDKPYQVPPEKVNQPPVARERAKSVNQYGGQTLNAPINTGDLSFDLDEYENEDSHGTLKDSKNVKVSMKLVELITKDIKRQFGGNSQIEEITITAGGGLVLNGFSYMPQFDDALIESMPQTKQIYYQNGDLAKVVNIGAVVDNIMDNVFTLSVESPSVANSTVFQNEIGVKNYNYSVLFRRMSNLQTIYLPDGELNRNNPNQEKSGLGLGAKLSNLFGFGRGKKDSQGYVPNPSPTNNRDSMTDRIFDSKPVRILTGALGWTLGCKAVVLAATIFGPWGLLFGAFAAAGAYKEIKDSRQQNDRNAQSGRRQSRNSGQSQGNRQSQGRQQSQGKKSQTNKNNGFNQQYSGRPPQNNSNNDWD